MSESQRIEELRQRVEKDPTSIAFAQLAEEYRRAGDYAEAVKVCRSGLAQHPAYVSARVTLARALIELKQFDDAQVELESVIDVAPDNLAAIRALAELHQHHGDTGETLAGYRSAASRVPAVREASSPAPLAEADDAVVQITIEERQVNPLDALVLDLPPAPDFSAFSLDTKWSLPDELIAVPPIAQRQPDAPEPPAAPPAFVASPASVAAAAVMPEIETVAPIASAHTIPAAPASDPAIDELEKWLAAIVQDRAQPR